MMKLNKKVMKGIAGASVATLLIFNAHSALNKNTYESWWYEEDELSNSESYVPGQNEGKKLAEYTGSLTLTDNWKKKHTGRENAERRKATMGDVYVYFYINDNDMLDMVVGEYDYKMPDGEIITYREYPFEVRNVHSSNVNFSGYGVNNGRDYISINLDLTDNRTKSFAYYIEQELHGGTQGGDSSLKTEYTWTKDGDKWILTDETGRPSSGWSIINNKQYLTDENGVMYTGWVKFHDDWYYMNKSGHMQKGWVKVNNKWYYFDYSGRMQTGWQKINKNWYYMNSSGRMQTGWFQSSKNGPWYYSDSGGRMQTGWQKINGSWYYMNSSGRMQTGWQKIRGSWYYMNSSGRMQTGTIKLDGKSYFLNKSGRLANN